MCKVETVSRNCLPKHDKTCIYDIADTSVALISVKQSTSQYAPKSTAAKNQESLNTDQNTFTCESAHHLIVQIGKGYCDGIRS